MSNLIAIKPLSQTKQARHIRQLRLYGDPKADEIQARIVIHRRAKIDKRKRKNSANRYRPQLSMSRWNEVARHRSLGRDTGKIAVYTNLPEWIVKILAEYIALTQAGQGTASENLRAANDVIVTINKRRSK